MKRKTDNFSKFFEKKKKSGTVKEAFKQEKRAVKKERKDAIERHFEEKRRAKAERFGDTGAASAPSAGKPVARPAKYSKPIDQAKAPKYVKPGGRTPERPVHGGKPIQKGQLHPQQKVHSPVSQKPTSPAAFQKPTPPTASQKSAPPRQPASGTDLIPLNKYIAHGGICSRRDAAELIRQGKVLLNGQPVTEPGTRVAPSDLVQVNGKKITMSRNFAYILLNKPKDYITTTDDPLGRKTVLDLIRQATPERVYPIGRLDRNTSGVLLLTNDGDLAQKLAHPSHEVKKIYHVTLDKVLTKADFEKIAQGVTLDDGLATVDVIAYADAKDKSQIGLEIHSGRNRIVRRIFEQLGYDVRGLDRVMYAGLTKKNVQRGKWRLLTEKEIRILKYLNSSGRTAAPRGTAAETNPAAPIQAKPARPAKAGSAGTPHNKPGAPVKSGSPARPGSPAKPGSVPNASPGKTAFNPSFRKRSPRKGPSPKAD